MNIQLQEWIADIKAENDVSYTDPKIKLEPITALIIAKQKAESKLVDPTPQIRTLQGEIGYLDQKKQASRLIPKIKKYVAWLRWYKAVGTINLPTSRGNITRKKSDLMGELVISEYVDIFNTETERLDCNFGLKVESYGSHSATIKELKDGTPRKSYVQQLAMYMHLTGAQLGHLFVLSIDGKNTFHFECKPLGDGRYKCGSVVVNPGKELERLIRIYKENVLTKTMPDIWEHKYKDDIESIDWSSLSTNAISEARNNKRVIGSTEVHYSNWKDKIIKLQGSTLGYNDLELMRIKELTKGFSVKK